ncbi:MAG: hypothetical protein IJY06_10265 [Oscillospiraceae bacterium]|jgi:hypothetical protein|nr:hypothetical protein [Oscillospiraceae bacterium]
MSDKKKKKGAPSFLTLGMLAVVALLFFLGYEGGGVGSGSGSGIIQDSPSVQQQQQVAQPTPTEAPKAVLDVTVSGSDYLFKNQRLDLSSLVSQLTEYGKDADIRISSDETATINAMNSLTDALAANGFTNYSKR